MVSMLFCPVCGAANELAATRCFACEQVLTTGIDSTEVHQAALLHDRYQLDTLLGSGGFSLVYHARDIQAGGRDVAIKQINLQGLSAEETIEATDTFNREVKLLSVLHHPQIPQLYDHFHDRDHWYLVLEYLEGTTLEAYLETRDVQSKPLQLDEVLPLAQQLCVVLEYLHTRQPPVIFRDLKPGNIIRAPDGKLSLIDFGIARHFRPGQIRDTQRLGSPGYAAPEQYGRMQTTPQADIYSLGILLHALLSGHDPSTQPQGLVPFYLASSQGERDLGALLQRMTSSDPAQRPAHVGEVAAILAQVKQVSSISNNNARIWTPPVSQAYPPQAQGQQQVYLKPQAQSGQNILPPAKLRTGRRKILAGAGIIAVAWIGGNALWRTLKQPGAPLAPGLPQIPKNAPTNLLYSYQGHSAAVWYASWSPLAKRIASCSLDQTVQIWDAFSGDNAFVYQGHTKAVMDAAWSPDGRRIASSSEDKTVHIWNASDGSDTLIYSKHADDVQEANWSPSGNLIASASLDQTVRIWNAERGRTLGVYQGHTRGVLAARWSPDEAHIASSSEDTTVQIWEAATISTLVTYQGHTASVSEVAWSPDGKYIASASDDQTVQVWNASDGSHVFTYTGHTRAVNGLEWSPNGKQIASASDDQTVQVWNAFDGSNIFIYKGHTQPVLTASWYAGGTLIASASEDQTIQIWFVP